MAYGPDQRKNAQTILAVGKRLGASKKALKAALEAGITESSLRNLSYGDRDSVGVFQQRPSQGWKGLTNVSKAAEEFFRQAIPNAGKYGTAGQLAQAVQRSAYPGRYDQHSAEANALLRGTSTGTGTPYSAPVKTAPSGYGQDAKTQMALSLIGFGNLGGGGYGQDDPLTAALIAAAQQPQKQPKAQGKAPAYGGAAPMASGTYPLGKRGKIIGTPYSGTHGKAFNQSGGSDNWQSENAVDVSIPVGTPVYAEEDGVLGNTGSLGMGGRFAGLRTNLVGKSNAYYYAHLSKLVVKQGQRVKKGQLLGYSGSANGSPHLHFAVQKGDPRNYVR